MSLFLFQKLDALREAGTMNEDIPNYLSSNLNPSFDLRPYQINAFN